MENTASINLLLEAIRREDVHQIRAFLDAGINVNEKSDNSEGDTPLHWATKLGKHEIMKLLISSNADVNARNSWDYTPLEKAIEQRGSLNSIKILVEAGTDLKDRGELRQSALHYAVVANNVRIIEYLLSKGADVDIKGRYGRTPLRDALYENSGGTHIKVIVALLEAGANVNAPDAGGKSPFHAFAEIAKFRIIEDLFLKYKADVNVKDENGETPFLKVLNKDCYRTVKLFVDQGAEVNIVSGVSGLTPLHEACNVAHNFRTIKLLLKKGAEVNVQDKNGKTPLHNLAKHGDAKEIALLIKYKADVNIKDNRGVVPLYEAVCSKNMEGALWLLYWGSDVNNVNTETGSTPLHEACKNYRNNSKSVFSMFHEEHYSVNMIKSLLKNGANINVVDHNGLTPLKRILNLDSYEKLEYEPRNILRFLLKFVDFGEEMNNVFLRYLPSLDQWVCKNIMAQVAKFVSLDIPVHQSILDTISCEDEKHIAKILEVHFLEDMSFESIVNVKQKYKKYLNQCVEELLAAKSTKLRGTWITLFNLLVDSRRKLKNYAGNRDLIEDFKIIGYDEKFPIYSAEMKKNIEKGIKRRELFDRASIMLSDCLPIFNPNHLIVRDILDCVLSRKDLNKFCMQNRILARL